MRTEIKYGLIIGLVGGIWLILEYLFGLHNEHIEIHPYVSSIAFVIPIIGIALAIREKRDKENGGVITYGEIIKAGLIISVITGFISLAFQYVYLELINPDYFKFMIEYSKEKMKETTTDPNVITYAVNEAEGYLNPKSYLLQSFFIPIVLGFFITLVVGIFVKKDNRNLQ